MDPVPPERLRSHVRSVDPEEFDRFVAELLAEQGWRTGLVDGSYEPGVDAVVARDAPDRKRHLVRVEPDGEAALDRERLDRYAAVPEGADDVDGVVLVTPGRFSERVRAAAGEVAVAFLDVDDLCGIVEDADAYDLVGKYSELDDDLPPEFAEVIRGVGFGPVADLDDGEKRRRVQALVAHAPGPRVTEEALLDTVEYGALFTAPLADYLREEEQPAHLLKEGSGGVEGPFELEPAGEGATYHLVTNERILTVVGRPDGDATLSVPLRRVEAVEFHPATFEARVELTVGGERYRFPVHHGAEGDVVEGAVEYVRGGPHPWKETTFSLGSIDDPATFGSVDTDGPAED